MHLSYTMSGECESFSRDLSLNPETTGLVEKVYFEGFYSTVLGTRAYREYSYGRVALLPLDEHSDMGLAGIIQ